VASGVADQPMTDEETITGALNRVNDARSRMPGADFWVGIEGGLQSRGGELEAFAWVVVESKNGVVGKGRTATFFLPPVVAEKIHGGMELGHANDLVFNEKNSKQNQGAVGILTGGVIDRTAYYVDPAVLALIPFKNRALYS
jgi:inosine/xanthosine triphosphatase